ncbi:MAG: DUF3857 domain-containing protein, partial [Candidatus Krumholzibacteriota bacterium]|nr:DUF3857 domain-containing protein [Candidatus Krumholzibacteriota bacterium]
MNGYPLKIDLPAAGRGRLAGLLLVLLIPCLVSTARADNEISDWESWSYNPDRIARLRSDFPRADAVVLQEIIDVAWDGRERISRTVYRRVALFSDNAIGRYGDPRILFDSSRQELLVEVARVYMRDGKTVDIRAEAVNQTTPFPLARTPDYTHWQETVVTYLGLEKSAVAELVYTIRDRERADIPPGGVESLVSADPALIRILRVSVPPGSGLKYTSLCGAPQPELPATGVYIWRWEDPGKTSGAGSGLWEGDYLPTVCYSAAESWEGIARTVAVWIDEAVRERENIAGAVSEITGKARPEDYDKLVALHRA